MNRRPAGAAARAPAPDRPGDAGRCVHGCVTLGAIACTLGAIACTRPPQRSIR